MLGLGDFVFGCVVLKGFDLDVFVEVVIDEAEVGFDYVVFVTVLFLA